jgi:hypothetical protein
MSGIEVILQLANLDEGKPDTDKNEEITFDLVKEGYKIESRRSNKLREESRSL